MNGFLKHTLIYFFSKGIPGILSFLGIIIYSKHLSPDDYGVYSLIISIVGIINIIFFDWFRYGMSRFLPEFIVEGKRDHFINFVFDIISKSTFLFALLGFICYLFFPVYLIGIDRSIIAIICGLSLIQYVFTLLTQIFVTELKPINFMAANISKAVISFSCCVILLLTGVGFMSLIIGTTLGYLVPSIYSFLKIRVQKLKFNKKTFDKELFKKIFHYSMPLTASAGLSFLLAYSNRFIINFFKGNEETGLFSLGYDFSQQTIGVIISIAATSATPIAMKLYSESGNSEDLKKHMNQSIYILFLLSVPVVSFFFGNSKDLISLFLGENFQILNKNVLPIVSLSAFVLGVKSFFFDIYFYLMKENKYQFLILVIVTIINVIFNFVFVPHFGYVAAIWGGLLTSSVAVVSTFFVTRKLIYIPIRFMSLLTIVLAGIIMYLAMMVFGQSKDLFEMTIKSICGVLLYVTVVISTNKNLQQFLVKKLKV